LRGFLRKNIRIRENLSGFSVEIQEIGMTQVPRTPSETGFAPRQIVLGLITVFSLTFITSFFIQTLGIARPRMAADLNGMSLYAWSISIPSLAAAFVTLLFSKFSDMYGRRFMLLICMVLFLGGTIWSALAPTFVILIAGNTLSRLGNGALAPLLYSGLGDMFAPVERSKWVGLLRVPQGFLALFGPTLGEWFVDNLSWRHLYWMGVPLLVLGPVMNTAYAKKLETTLPAGLHQFADKATITALSDPKALLSPTAMKKLEATFAKEGIYGNDLFRQTIRAIRTSMEAGLRGVFLLGAVTMLISFLLILTVPEVSMDAVV
jgi:MFS family permease